MHEALLILALLTASIWIYIVVGRGFFWRISPSSRQSPSSSASIVAVVPARNESETIGACVSSLLRQSVPNLHVVVVDDSSTDGTSDAARVSAQSLNASDRLTVISGQPLRAGWTGKLWALQQGIECATQRRPDFLLLTDADIEHGRDTVGSLIAASERESLDLASYMVKLHCASVAEKLLIPAFVYFFLQLYPPTWIADTKSKTAGAAGGCNLVRPAALTKAGGMEGIRAEIIDDCALATAVKRSGGRLSLGLTSDSHSLRPYNTFGEIGRMISRTAFSQLRHSAVLLVLTIVGLCVMFLLPIALVIGWPTLAGLAKVGLASTALLLMVVSYAPMVRFYGLNPLWTLTLPFASIFYMGATIWSAVQYWTGRGGQWKGRTQDRSRVVAE